MRICQNCSSSFIVSKYHPNQKYCCSKCARYVIARRRYGLGPKKQKLICSVCDNQFLQKRLNNTEYCSESCKRLGTFRKSKGLQVKGPRKHTKGSGYIQSNGYKILSKKHPNASKRGQILEHKLIMSQYLGRPLFSKETVHHRNGIRHDNRIENLELWSSSHPPGQRVEDKIEWCKEFLEIYGYNVIKKINHKFTGEIV